MALPWDCHGLVWQCHGSTPMGLDGTPIALLWALMGRHGVIMDFGEPSW